MNTRHIFSVMLIWGWCLLAVSCKEDLPTDHLDGNAAAPAAIDRNRITHENFAGGAVIRYRIPKDGNLLYVKATYETAPGVVRTTKTSFYSDSLVVEGFGEAGAYDVYLYSVGKNEKQSEAVIYQITPDQPPVLAAWETLTLSELFGGVRGSFRNETEVPLTVVLSADTTGTGVFTPLRAFTLSDRDARFAYTGLDTVSTTFSVYMKDRWGNRTVSRVYSLKPMFEEAIPKNTWRQWTLPSDYDIAVESEAQYGMPHLWDGIADRSHIFATGGGGINAPLPYHFTFSLGVTVIVSRVVYHHRTNQEFRGPEVKKFELWGSDSDNPGDDLLSDDWFRLGQFESKIPSGNTTPTPEDASWAVNVGESFYLEPADDIPDPFRPVKFLRVRVISTWDDRLAGQIIIAELDLHGQIIK